MHTYRHQFKGLASRKSEAHSPQLAMGAAWNDVIIIIFMHSSLVCLLLIDNGMSCWNLPLAQKNLLSPSSILPHHIRFNSVNKTILNEITDLLWWNVIIPLFLVQLLYSGNTFPSPQWQTEKCTNERFVLFAKTCFNARINSTRWWRWWCGYAFGPNDSVLYCRFLSASSSNSISLECFNMKARLCSFLCVRLFVHSSISDFTIPLDHFWDSSLCVFYTLWEQKWWRNIFLFLSHARICCFRDEDVLGNSNTPYITKEHV